MTDTIHDLEEVQAVYEKEDAAIAAASERARQEMERLGTELEQLGLPAKPKREHQHSG